MGVSLSMCREIEPACEGEISLSHFTLLRVVGKGAFGKVRMVRYKKTAKVYALKYIDKTRCIKQKSTENIVQERRLLEEASSPFICNLRFAFQDSEHLFMVLDLMLGGDLRFHLDKLRTFNEKQCKFFIKELSCGLFYLHSLNIVHRDLKPDNILLDEFGHVHLTDFNIATYFRDDKLLTAVAGSMAYMAPEILKRRGYRDSIDWWSLGVVLFELLFGKRPFRAKTTEELTQSVLYSEPIYPLNASNVITQNCLNFLSKLLTKDITRRIGTKESGGELNFRSHPWFDDTRWSLVTAKKAQPVFVPDSSHSNFDATHELVELLLDDKPLTHKRSIRGKGRRQAQQKRHSRSDRQEDEVVVKEKRFMEDTYLVFDHSKPKGYRSFQSGTLSEAETLKDLRRKSTIDKKETILMSDNGMAMVEMKSEADSYKTVDMMTYSIGLKSLHADIMEGKSFDFDTLAEISKHFDEER